MRYENSNYAEYFGVEQNQNALEHHGIKGQKWGIRRFQNEDGSYTTEGKERYGYTSDGKKAGGLQDWSPVNSGDSNYDVVLRKNGKEMVLDSKTCESLIREAHKSLKNSGTKIQLDNDLKKKTDKALFEEPRFKKANDDFNKYFNAIKKASMDGDSETVTSLYPMAKAIIEKRDKILNQNTMMYALTLPQEQMLKVMAYRYETCPFDD